MLVTVTIRKRTIREKLTCIHFSTRSQALLATEIYFVCLVWYFMLTYPVKILLKLLFGQCIFPHAIFCHRSSIKRDGCSVPHQSKLYNNDQINIFLIQTLAIAQSSTYSCTFCNSLFNFYLYFIIWPWFMSKLNISFAVLWIPIPTEKDLLKQRVSINSINIAIYRSMCL